MALTYLVADSALYSEDNLQKLAQTGSSGSPGSRRP